MEVEAEEVEVEVEVEVHCVTVHVLRCDISHVLVCVLSETTLPTLHLSDGEVLVQPVHSYNGMHQDSFSTVLTLSMNEAMIMYVCMYV